MFVLAGFAFVAGVVTILSPCILPLLPIILSSSTSGSKKRPFGVVTGFVVSFTFFTLFLSTIVSATGLSAGFLRNLAVVILIGFGLSLLIPKTQELLEKLFTNLSNKTPQQRERSGFGGGVIVGISLGLIWTPCVGPILASVISLALTGTVSGTALIIALAYSIGTGLPMLAIIFGGRQLLQKVPWLLRNTSKIQKAFGLLMIVTAVGILFNVDRTFQSYILEKFPNYGLGLTQIEDNETVQKELDNLDNQNIKEEDMGKPMDEFMDDESVRAPELISGGSWFNSEPLKISELKGRVVLVDFWTYTCINCIRTLPYIENWYEKYQDKGLVIVGVHTPEFEFEKNPDNVMKAIKDFGLTYPIMQDNDYKTWRAYSNHYWPAKYLIDKDGKIRYTHFGEGKYDESEKWIQILLEETGSDVQSDAISNQEYDINSRTPELYLGYSRIAALASPERISANKVSQYSLPSKLPDNTFAYVGDWKLNSEYAIPEAGSSLVLNYESQNVFLVMRSQDGPAKILIRLDGNALDSNMAGVDLVDSGVTVDIDRLYTLVQADSPGQHQLTLEFPEGGVELYAFTFG